MIHSASLHSLLLTIISLSIRLTLPLSRTLLVLHPVTPSLKCTVSHLLDHNTVTSPHLLLIGLSGDAITGTRPFDWIIQGNPRETPPIFDVHLKTRVSDFLRVACMLHQTKTWLNSCFRCAGAFQSQESSCRHLTGDKAHQILFDRLELVWLCCRFSRVQI